MFGWTRTKLAEETRGATKRIEKYVDEEEFYENRGATINRFNKIEKNVKKLEGTITFLREEVLRQNLLIDKFIKQGK